MLNQAVNAQQFEALIQQHDIVVVDFWAEWCVPCKQFKTIYERVAAQYPTIMFTNINVELESELAEMFQIRSIPHLLIFKQGIVIYSESGSMPESTLKELLEQALSVDVSVIRSKIDAGEL